MKQQKILASQSQRMAGAALPNDRHAETQQPSETTSTAQSNSPSPTADIYGRLQFVYSYFNATLFEGKLPNCLLTLIRQKNTLGYFGADFFASKDAGRAHEMSLNPAYFKLRGDVVTQSTLVHEQVHLARHEFGPPNRIGGRVLAGITTLFGPR